MFLNCIMIEDRKCDYFGNSGLRDNASLVRLEMLKKHKYQSVFMAEGQKGSLLSLPASIQSSDSGTGTLRIRKHSLESIRKAIRETTIRVDPLEESDTEVKFCEF